MASVFRVAVINYYLWYHKSKKRIAETGKGCSALLSIYCSIVVAEMIAYRFMSL